MPDSPQPQQRPARATIYDVAERAGVSIATVSFCYSKPDRVAPTTRDRVLRAAAELGYVRRAAARDLALGRTRVLGFWTYDYTDFTRSTAAAHGLSRAWDWPIFIDEVERGFKRRAWSLDYSILVEGNQREGQEERIRDLASRVDAIAVMPNSMPAATRDALAAQLPLVAIAEIRPESESISFVGTDNRTAMQLLTEHLLQVHGHRDLRFVGSGSLDYDVRFEGFCDALRGAGIDPPPAPEGGFGSAWHAYQALDTVEESLSRGIPDAFVCASDLHAAYAAQALEAAGLRVPDDVALTGFDNLQASETSSPPLTTVDQPMQRMGERAAEVLCEAIDRGTRERVILIEPSTPVVRQSCGC